MLDIFLRLKTLVKVSHIHIDSSVFRLHWCISSVILLTFSVIITTRQYVGNPIDCIHTNDVPDDVFDLYCWIHSTYTIPRALSLHVGEQVAHPGVITSSVDEEDERRYVSYYQWVGFTLFFQVISGASAERELSNFAGIYIHIYIRLYYSTFRDGCGRTGRPGKSPPS